MSKKSSVADLFNSVKVNTKRESPLWNGPEKEGITYSLLCRFLTCRERFRLLVMEGLRGAETFNPRMEYGNLWHVCEEWYAKDRTSNQWESKLGDYCKTLCSKYPTQANEIIHWYGVCLLQFPQYIKYWHANSKNQPKRTPLLQEQSFCVPYKLPSGRTVKLRGKFDSVDLTDHGILLQENKTKGEIDEQKIKRQLSYDLQTMMYLVALKVCQSQKEHVPSNRPIVGVCYNVVRRPLSGGKGTIRQHKPSKSNPAGESKEEFYGRVADYIKNDPGSYFVRWDIPVSEAEVESFREQCLNPILEQLCNWWGFITAKDPAVEEYGYGLHWRHPFGVRNILDEGGSTDLDNYLLDGNEVGLIRIENLFPELT